jgi:hypothetical protein
MRPLPIINHPLCGLITTTDTLPIAWSLLSVWHASERAVSSAPRLADWRKP